MELHVLAKYPKGDIIKTNDRRYAHKGSQQDNISSILAPKISITSASEHGKEKYLKLFIVVFSLFLPPVFCAVIPCVEAGVFVRERSKSILTDGMQWYNE